ncbi:MAG: VanZ family protein [Candidatus Sericytochromatia bacterium]
MNFNLSKKILYFIPSIIVMIIIFIMSADPVSGEKSSNIVKIIFNLLNSLFSINFKPEDEYTASFIVRKIAHISEYMILTFSYYYGFSKYKQNFKKNYSYAIFLAFLYAISDEYHQTFVAGRVGTYEDVLIDSVGMLTGYFILKYYFLLTNKIIKSFK